jgi:hypothetical protein
MMLQAITQHPADWFSLSFRILGYDGSGEQHNFLRDDDLGAYSTRAHSDSLYAKSVNLLNDQVIGGFKTITNNTVFQNGITLLNPGTDVSTLFVGKNGSSLKARVWNDRYFVIDESINWYNINYFDRQIFVQNENSLTIKPINSGITGGAKAQYYQDKSGIIALTSDITGSTGVTYDKSYIDSIANVKENLLTHNNQQVYYGNGGAAVQSPNFLFDPALNKLTVIGAGTFPEIRMANIPMTGGTKANDILFNFTGIGATSTGVMENNASGLLRLDATEDHTATAQGSMWRLFTKPNGTNSFKEGLRVNHDGSVLTGGSLTVPGNLSLTGNITFPTDNLYSIGTATVGASAIYTFALRATSVTSSIALTLGTINNNSFIFQVAGTERMRLALTTGNLLLGSSTDDGLNKLQVSGGASINNGKFTLQGNQTINTAFNNNTGVGFQQSAITYLSTVAAGTIGSAYINYWAPPTLAANSATTLTKAYSNVFSSPSAGTNVTIGTGFAAGFNGNIEVTGAANVNGRLAINTASGQQSIFQIGSNSAFGTNGTFNVSGYGMRQDALTYTSTTSSGTIALAAVNGFATQTIAASNATTITDMVGNYFVQPTAGTNVTFTNRYAVGWVGDELFINNSTGPVIKDSNGVKYRIVVAPGGALSTVAL